MASIKVRKFKDSVYVIYSHKNKKFKIYTGVKVEDQFWNLCAPRKNCPNLDNVLSQIRSMETSILNASMAVRTRGIDPDVTSVRNEFYAQLTSVQPGQSFWERYREYLSLLTCRKSTKRIVGMTYRVLEYYCTWSGFKFDIDNWDASAFGRFVQYLLLRQKMADTTIQRHVKWLRSFLKYAYPDKNFSWMRYIVMPVEEEIITLTEGELRYLIEAELSGTREKTRDLFVFLATTGMRFSDSQLFNPSWIAPEQVLEFTQLKTGGKAFPPIYEASSRVLHKYNGIPPKISNQRFNINLKLLFTELEIKRPVTIKTVKGRNVITKICPLNEVVSSHAARRTFISLCLEKGMPLQDVMKMSGHSDFKSMKPYINITRKHIRAIADKWQI